MTEHSKLIVKHGGYRNLKGFRMAQLSYDITVAFCERFVDRRSRTRDQMVQAARSGVQNIAEGSQASATSKKTELKLTGVARASLEELALDYQDYLRQNGLETWPREHTALAELRRRRPESLEEFRKWVNDKELHESAGRAGPTGPRPHDAPGPSPHHGDSSAPSSQSNPSSQSSQSSPSSPSSPSSLSSSSSSSSLSNQSSPPIAERVCNGALLMIGVACFCLDRQLAALGEAFERDGGFTERLHRVRRDSRGW